MGYEEIKFDDLKKELIVDSEELMRENIEKGLNENKLDLSSITHLYHLITKKACNFLVKFENNIEDLEDGYSNILNLISITLKIKTDPPRDKTGEIDEKKRKPLVESLWENRNQLNEIMNHYIKQIQNLRTLEFRKITKKSTLYAIIISAIPIIISIISLVFSISSTLNSI